MPTPEELGRVYRPALGDQRVAARLRRRARKRCSRRNEIAWSCADGRGAQRITSPGPSSPPSFPGEFQSGEVMALAAQPPAGGRHRRNGAGNYAIWVDRFHALPPLRDAARADLRLDGLRGARGDRRQAAFPDRTVVAFAGDGCFLMNGQEFATAVQYDLPVIVVVVDNGMYGTIRMHQEREYPGRVSATTLKNPDFAAYADAFGGHGERVETTDRVRAGLRARGRVAASPRSCTA